MNKITDIKGIGGSTAVILSKHGIKTVEDLASIRIDKLIDVPGFNNTRSSRVIKEAQLILNKSEELAEGDFTQTSEKPVSPKGKALKTTKKALKKGKKAKGKKKDKKDKDKKKKKKQKIKKQKDKGKKGKNKKSK